MSRNAVRVREVWHRLVAFVAVVGIAASAAVPVGVSAQESLPSIAEAAPESTVVFHWTDLDRDGAQWQQTAELLARVGLSDAIGTWEEAVLADGERSGDITEAELDALLGGEMAVAVLPAAVEHVAAMALSGLESDTLFRSPDATPEAGADAEPVGIVAILRPGDIDAAWDYAERQFADAAAETGVLLEETTHGTAEVLVLPPGEQAAHPGMNHDDAAKNADHWMGGHGMHGRGGFAAALVGEFIVAGKTETDLAAVIDVVEGNAGSLAESAEAQAVAAELPGESLSFLYVDGQGILDALDPEAIAILQTLMMETPVEALGSQTGLAVSADASGFRFDSVTIYNDAVDLASITVENDPAVADAAARVPADSFVFQAGRLPANAFVGAPYQFAQMVNAAETGQDGSGNDDEFAFPTEEEMAEAIATASATLDFDLETDLFDLLGDEYVAFATFPSISLEDFGIDAVAALSTTDPDALAETMAKIAAWIDRSDSGADVVVRQLADARVFVASSEEMEGAPGLPGLPGLEFGVVEGQAVIGLGAGIDALTSAPVESLADDVQFQTVMGLLPDAYYQVGYVDIGQAIDPVMSLVGTIEALQAGSLDSLATPAAEVPGPRNIRALGMVSFQEGNVSGSSAILYIGG